MKKKTRAGYSYCGCTREQVDPVEWDQKRDEEWKMEGESREEWTREEGGVFAMGAG